MNARDYQGLLDKNSDQRITLNQNDTETVDKFSHFRKILITEEKVQETAISRIRSA